MRMHAIALESHGSLQISQDLDTVTLDMWLSCVVLWVRLGCVVCRLCVLGVCTTFASENKGPSLIPARSVFVRSL